MNRTLLTILLTILIAVAIFGTVIVVVLLWNNWEFTTHNIPVYSPYGNNTAAFYCTKGTTPQITITATKIIVKCIPP